MRSTLKHQAENLDEKQSDIFVAIGAVKITMQMIQ